MINPFDEICVEDYILLQYLYKHWNSKILLIFFQRLESERAEWILQLRKNKDEAVAMKELNRQKTIALKKASKIYKQRLEYFTGDMENLTSQIRDQVSI